MTCVSFRYFGDDIIDDILEASQKLLDFGQDALELSPIPGLNIAAGVLSSVIGMIQVGMAYST